MHRQVRNAWFSLLALSVILINGSTQLANGQTAPEGFTVTVVEDAFTRATVGFALLPDGRIFVAHHQNGFVDIVVDGVVKPEPIFVVDSLTTSSEQGLLGIAVDPDFPDSNYVYLFHTTQDSTNQISRFTVQGDLNDPSSNNLTIDAASIKPLLVLDNVYHAHNGGTLRFGNDKTLYVSHGDDGQTDFIQSLTNVNGKILRINRDGSIPVDNPVFPDEPEGMREEIFAIGLRNPFRFSIDSETDELFIADVGTDLFQELNVSSGGENFGYPHYEGDGFFREYVDLIPPEPTFPIHSYAQSARGRSVTAIAVYRPTAVPDNVSFPPEFDGAYFFADFFDSELKYVTGDGEAAYQVHSFGTGYANLVDGGVAHDGSLYALSYQKKLIKISYTAGPSSVATTEVPEPILVESNYPNPFDRATSIEYQLENPVDHVTIDVFDTMGRRVAHLFDGFQPAGQHSITFDGSERPQGLYILRLQAGATSVSKTMTLARR